MHIDTNSLYEHPRHTQAQMIYFDDLVSPLTPGQRRRPEDRMQACKYEQHLDLKIYLDMKISEPYNHFCINCKRRKSTHFLLWLGAFVCGNCAEGVKQTCGGNKYCYVKDVFGDQWDDYQLRAVAHGGNQNLFTVMKEYDIETTNLVDSYNSPGLTWYRKHLISKMDQVLAM